MTCAGGGGDGDGGGGDGDGGGGDGDGDGGGGDGDGGGGDGGGDDGGGDDGDGTLSEVIGTCCAHAVPAMPTNAATLYEPLQVTVGSPDGGAPLIHASLRQAHAFLSSTLT